MASYQNLRAFVLTEAGYDIIPASHSRPGSAGPRKGNADMLAGLLMRHAQLEYDLARGMVADANDREARAAEKLRLLRALWKEQKKEEDEARRARKRAVEKRKRALDLVRCNACPDVGVVWIFENCAHLACAKCILGVIAKRKAGAPVAVCAVEDCNVSAPEKPKEIPGLEDLVMSEFDGDDEVEDVWEHLWLGPADVKPVLATADVNDAGALV